MALTRYMIDGESVMARLFTLSVALLIGCLITVAPSWVEENFTPQKLNVPDAVEVTLYTTMGDIVLELDGKRAPITVDNFLHYVNSYFYDGLIFHRVIDGFMIQTGGHFYDMIDKDPTRDPIVNESDNGLTNQRGTVAMARFQDPDSARSHFFINLHPVG